MVLALAVILGVVGLAPRSRANPLPSQGATQMSYDADDDDDEWKCTCSVSCDGAKFSVSERVCADDEDLKDAMRDAVNDCYRDADARCDEEPVCKCKCKTTGKDC